MTSEPPEKAAGALLPPLGKEVAGALAEVERLLSAGELRRAQEELQWLRQPLVADPTRKGELEAVERRLREVGELRVQADCRLRDHLQRGQFFMKGFQYAQAIRSWESQPDLLEHEEVRSRLALARGQLERLEAGIARIKAHLEAREPEAALVELAKAHPLDPENALLWNFEKTAEALLVQKQVTALKAQAMVTLEAGDYEAALPVLSRIAELSRHIVTVRWLRGVREESIRKLLADLERNLEKGDRAAVERQFRWIFRLNAAEGHFDQEIERLRRDHGLDVLGPAAPAPAAAPVQAPLLVREAGGGRGALRRKLWKRPPSRGLIMAPLALVLLSSAGHEVYNQIQIARADGLRSAGRFAEAEAVLERTRLVLIAPSRKVTLGRRIALESALAQSREALARRSWSRAESRMAAAMEASRQLPGALKEIGFALDHWRDCVLALARGGNLPEAWNGFEVLQRVERREEAGGRAEDRAGYEFVLKAGRAFLDRGGLSEALAAARRAERHPLVTPEAARLLTDIHAQMLTQARRAASSGELDRAPGLYKLLENSFPEFPIDVETTLRGVEFTRAVQAATRALERGETEQAREEYGRALELRPEGEEPLHNLRRLRERLAGPQPGAGGSPVPLTGRSDLAEPAAVASKGPRLRLPRGPQEVLTRSLYHGNLRCSWSAWRDPLEPERSLVIQGKATLQGGEQASAVGDLRIGLVLLSPSCAPVAGELVKVGLLLPGASQDFQVRLPLTGADWLQVGLTLP
jgi:tetratricopeptide (TPR) repeat protein